MSSDPSIMNCPRPDAKHPPAVGRTRASCVAPSGALTDWGVTDLISMLPTGSGVWVNETKVLHARMMARKPTGGVLELLLLEPRDVPVEKAGLPLPRCVEHRVEPRNGSRVLSKCRTRCGPSGRVEGEALRFSWQGDARFGDILDHLGRIPLPPHAAGSRRRGCGPLSDRIRPPSRKRGSPDGRAVPDAGLIASMEARESTSAK